MGGLAGVRGGWAAVDLSEPGDTDFLGWPSGDNRTIKRHWPEQHGACVDGRYVHSLSLFLFTEPLSISGGGLSIWVDLDTDISSDAPCNLVGSRGVS